MMNLIQTTLLASTVRIATASSFSDLTYGSSPQSASSIIDAIFNGGGDADETATSYGSTDSTIASLNTVVETDFIADAFEGGNAQQNVCAPSMAEAQSKLCSGESTTTCQDAMDCSFGEACFLQVVCEATTISTSPSRDDFEISHFVMLGKDSQGDVMTLANSNMLQTTTPAAEPERPAAFSSDLVPNMSQFSSTATSVSSQIESTLEMIQEEIDNELFLYETPLSDWIPSTVYRFSGFYDGLKVMHSVGVAGKKLYLGANSPENDFLGTGKIQDVNNCAHCFMYGLVNIAAFLAQAMKETIRYDACDENSWDRVGLKEMYPISNSCGQLGQSYQDYHCSEEEKHMECPVDPEMTITAVTHAKWWGAPGPLMCGPKSLIPQTGYWDYAYECNNPWKNPPETCDVYDEQKAGKAINDEAYPNAAGRTDVEGCCWWGRGVIQTSGVCNFGKLNYYLGKRAFLEGRDSRYPDIDFCRDPEIICKSEEHKELKWIAGFFYWVDQVQPYNTGGWNYLAELKHFVDGGMTGDAFINSVSGIVNRGCHNPPCGTGDLDGGPERAENFFRILKALDFSFVDIQKPPTDAPTPLPTPCPAKLPIVGTASPISSTVSYNCGDGSQFIDSNYDESSPSIDLSFDYEVHSDLDVPVSQALQDIKQSILSDMAERLECTESPQRQLQVSNGNVVGLLGSRSDMPDPDAAGCLVEVDALEPTACTPIKGEIKVFAESGSTETDLANMSEYLKDTIKNNMDAGNYESRTVKRVTWIGDRELYLEELNPSGPVVIQNEPEDSGVNWMKIAMYSLAGVCAFLLCLLCMIIPSTRRKSATHDEELAMMEYMNAQREHNAHREHNYKRRPSTGAQNPIQRRSEHLRAVQQGHPLQITYASEAGTATSESDDDDSYFRRRNSVQRRNSNSAAHHKIVAIPEQPIQRKNSARRIDVIEQHVQRKGSARYIDSAPAEPPMIVGDTGHFYVKSNQSYPQAVVDEEPQALEALPYQPQPGDKVESEPGDNSSSEEELPPVRPPRRRHSSRGAIELTETHDQRANAERRPKRETWAAPPRSNSHGMSKEERQRRIERARSNRKN